MKIKKHIEFGVNGFPKWVVKRTVFYVSKDREIIECQLECPIVDFKDTPVYVVPILCITNVPNIMFDSDIGNGFFWMLSNAMAVAGYRKKGDC